MEARLFRDIVRGLIFFEIFLSSVDLCVGSSPCTPEEDPSGRYTVIGSSVNIWSEGIPTGATVRVSVRCDQGATPQPYVVARCFNGTWLQPWPRCVYAPETPCSVPTNRENVRQFVNGLETIPITRYTSPTLPAGTQIVARCRDPGTFRLSGDQQRTCFGGQWTGEEPQCHTVSTRIWFFGAPRQLSSNGTVIVFVYNGHPRHLDVMCKSMRSDERNPRLTTTLENGDELPHWLHSLYHVKRLYPIAVEHSGTFTCSRNALSHSVHVLFKAAECDAPAAVPEHERLRDSYISSPRVIIPNGTTISFECEEGYRLVGSRMVTCNKGQWTDDPPTCTLATIV